MVGIKFKTTLFAILSCATFSASAAPPTSAKTTAASSLLRAHLLSKASSVLFVKVARQVFDPQGDIPAQCTAKCAPIVDALNDDTCQSNECFCTNKNGNALVTCLECTIGLAPAQNLIDDGQEIVDELVNQCALTGDTITPGKLNVPLPNTNNNSTATSASASSAPSTRTTIIRSTVTLTSTSTPFLAAPSSTRGTSTTTVQITPSPLADSSSTVAEPVPVSLTLDSAFTLQNTNTGSSTGAPVAGVSTTASSAQSGNSAVAVGEKLALRAVMVVIGALTLNAL